MLKVIPIPNETDSIETDVWVCVQVSKAFRHCSEGSSNDSRRYL